jgi:AcrR family transcriptional regulator
MNRRRGPGRPAGSDGAQLRQRLIDTCWALLQEAAAAGAGVSVTRICQAAGCTPPTLYHHFGTLDDLKRTACEQAFDAWSAALENDIGHQESPVLRLRRRGQAYVSWGVGHPAAYRVLFLSPPLETVPGSTPGRGFEPLVADLAQWLGRDATDPAVMIAALAHWSAVHGLTSLVITNPQLPASIWHATLRHLSDSLALAGLPGADEPGTSDG